MKLSFFGADQCVTGSCHCLEVNGKRILIDCGLQQGRDEIDNRELPFAPNTIDYVLITHAHIDHSGRVPMLVKQGFGGQIWTTRLTAELLEIMLADSAHIQESDAQYENRKNQRAGRALVEPIYTVEDAQRTMTYVHTCEYQQTVQLCDGVKATFTDAGHLLGSASITLELSENGVEKTVVFSGDIGNINQPIIRDPIPLDRADYVVMESTYGDRNHVEVWSYTSELAHVIDRTLGRGGNVIIPAFAVGRTQEILYFIHRIKMEGLVKSMPDFQVYIDSPLAGKATGIFAGDLHGYLDDEALDLVKSGAAMFSFPGLRLTESVEESKLLNADRTPKVIISASGMCDAGRIRHHLKYNLWRPESTIVFVGFQSPGTLGRNLLEGAKSVKLFGEDGSDVTACNWNNENGLKFMQYATENFRQEDGKFKSDDAKNLATAVLNNRLGACISGGWEMKDTFKGASNIKYRTLPSITIDGQQKTLKSFSNSKVYVVNNKSTHKATASRLAAYITSESSQLRYAADRGYYPSNLAAQQSDAVKDDPFFKVIRAQLDMSVPVPVIPEISRYWEAAKSLGTSVYNGSLKDDVESLQKSLNSFVSTVKEGTK